MKVVQCAAKRTLQISVSRLRYESINIWVEIMNVNLEQN